jgi:hypothetical protein
MPSGLDCRPVKYVGTADQIQRGLEPNIDKKAQLFRSPLAFSSAMEGVCSAQVQAQNKHRRIHRIGPRVAGGFADINIAKG